MAYLKMKAGLASEILDARQCGNECRTNARLRNQVSATSRFNPHSSPDGTDGHGGERHSARLNRRANTMQRATALGRFGAAL
jgi:hypothetical protein